MGNAKKKKYFFVLSLSLLLPSVFCMHVLELCSCVSQMTVCFVVLICTFLLILGSVFILLTQTTDSKERRGSGIKYSSASRIARLANENNYY